MAYVYGHRRLDKNHFFYIGIGNDKNYARANKKTQRTKHWNNIINKTEYEVIIIEDNISWEDACEKEKYWIKYYGRKDLKEGTLVNLTDGGEGAVGAIRSEKTRDKLRKINIGKKHSEEALKNMSLAQLKRYETSVSVRKGAKHSEETIQKIKEKRKLQVVTDEHKNNIRNALIGRIITDEWKQKISKSNIGKKHSNQTKEKISKNNWTKGKAGNLPEEYIQKLKDSQKNRWDKIKNSTDIATKEKELLRIEKIRKKNIGRTQSEETKRKISETKKRKNLENKIKNSILE